MHGLSGTSVAVVGLGLMGSRMSANLIEAGAEVRGYDIDRHRVQAFVEAGGIEARSPRDAVQGCETALVSVLTTDQSRDVLLDSDGIAAAGVDGLHVFDTTTGPPEHAVEFAIALAPRGISYCDTTVSGNSEVAERGELVVMMGGSAESYDFGTPIFEVIGRSHHHVGDVGSGSRMKLIVNHVLSIHRMALAEGLVFAEMGQMDLDKTLEILADGAAYSRAMDLWGKRMVDGDHEVPYARIKQTLKDSRLIVEQGLEMGAPMDLENVVLTALAEGAENGLADSDNSAVIEVVRRRAGIGRVE